MPQGGSKKNKGRAPAHQNAFAYKHNPKSKKTEKILNSPNIHVCRRCHEKIEWRKKYRKYKPLTQPTKCNLCQQRKVKAAYHTICTDCTTSDKARKVVVGAKQKDNAPPVTVCKEGTENETSGDSKRETSEPDGIYRVCAVCVKEPALPGEDDGSENDAETMLANETGRMRLRDQRSMERKLARQSKKAIGTEGEAPSEDVIINDGSTGKGGDGSEPGISDHGDVEEDPFVKAVGGSDKLLTGEAYQKMLLEREGQNL